MGTFPRAPQRGHTRWTPWHPLEPIRVGGTHPGSTMKNTSNENLNGPISDPTTCTRVTSKGHVSYYNTLLIYQCDTNSVSSSLETGKHSMKQSATEACEVFWVKHLPHFGQLGGTGHHWHPPQTGIDPPGSNYTPQWPIELATNMARGQPLTLSS